MKDVSLSFGDNVLLSDFSYNFNKGDRIGIVGRNGVGKVRINYNVHILLLEPDAYLLILYL